MCLFECVKDLLMQVCVCVCVCMRVCMCMEYKLTTHQCSGTSHGVDGLDYQR